MKQFFFHIYVHQIDGLKLRCINSWRQVARETKFCSMVSNICGPSVLNLLHVTLMTPKILRWHLYSWKICEPLV